MEPKKYTINGKTYVQKPLVIAQAMQMDRLLEGVEIFDLSPISILRALKEKLPTAMAIVLTPIEEKIQGKNLSALEDEFTENLDIDTALQVAEDFFIFNPISSISSRFRGLIGTIWGMLPKKEEAG